MLLLIFLLGCFDWETGKRVVDDWYHNEKQGIRVDEGGRVELGGRGRKGRVDNCQDSGGQGSQKRGPPPPIQEEEWTVLREGFLRRISGKDLRKGGKSRRKLNFPKMLIKITPKELPFSQTNGGISI